MSETRFDRAVAAIDAANAADPNTLVVGGEERPKELAHAEMVTAWVRRLDPGADEAQLLAARAHHLRRWVDPRSDHPPGRAGYLRWRKAQQARQAAEVAAILAEVGYDEATIARVQGLVAKAGPQDDPAAQVHEDALCLVFLATQLDGLIDDLGPERAEAVVAKTAAKMSAAGLAEAGALAYSPQGASVVAAALTRG